MSFLKVCREQMDGLPPENVKVSNYWLDLIEYLRKGSECDQNILLKNRSQQDNQCNPFLTQVAREIICPLQN